jgi:DNA mismatch endonuclease (patch repair protein)
MSEAPEAEPELAEPKGAVDPRRSELMSRIRSGDTKPELAVRKLLHALGLRFRLHRRDLPGKPDIVLPRFRTVIFVHGCFWHQHPGCKLASDPKSRREYWIPKLAGNVRRDTLAQAALRASGWRVEVIWECESRKPAMLAWRVQTLAETFARAKPPPPGPEVA